MYLDTPGEGVVKHLHSFRNLVGLKVSKVIAFLSVRQFKFAAVLPPKVSKARSDEVHAALDKLPGLTSLEVVNGRETLDLAAVSSCCPKLQSLQVFYSRGVQGGNSIGYFGSALTLNFVIK